MRKYEELLKKFRHMRDLRAARLQGLIPTPENFDPIDECVELYRVLRDLSTASADSTTGQLFFDPEKLKNARWFTFQPMTRELRHRGKDLVRDSLEKLQANPESRFNNPRVMEMLETSIDDVTEYAGILLYFDAIIRFLDESDRERKIVLRGPLREQVLKHSQKPSPTE